MTAPMMPGNSIGAAYADLVFDTSRADNSLRQKLQQAAQNMMKAMKVAGKKSGDEYTDAFGSTVAKNTKAVVMKMQQAIRQEKVEVEVTPRVNRQVVRRVASSFGEAFREAFIRPTKKGGGGGAAGGVGGVLGLFEGGLRSLGSSIGNVSSAGPLAPLIGGGLIVLIEGLVGAVAALLNVLGPLINALFLLPAALFTVVGAIAPVIVAFQDMGTAIGAVASGDIEAINEAFKDLGPNAQQAARDIAALFPWFRELRTASQEGFFGPLASSGVFAQFQQAVGPAFVQGMASVAKSAGEFATSFLKVFSSPNGVRFFELMFNSSSNLFKNLGGENLNRFLGGIVALSNATFPWIDKLTAALGDKLGDFGQWLNDLANSGQLNSMLDKMVQAARALWQLASSGWSLIKAIVGGTDEENKAREFFDFLISGINVLENFFRSEMGEAALKGMVTLAELLVVVLVDIGFLFAAIAATVEGISNVVNFIRSTLYDIARLIGIVGNDSTYTLIKGGAAAKPMAEGGILTSPELIYAGEAGPEVVIPLTDPQRAQQLAAQSGLTSILSNGSSSGDVHIAAGAVQLNFTGVPTPQQAYQIGQQAGNGLASMLAQRNTRLAVRTLSPAST